MKSKTLTTVLGIALVVIGIGYVGNVFEVWNFKLFFDGWWTLFIIVPALVKLITKGPRPIYFIWLAAGAILLVTSLDFIPEAVKGLVFPIIVLALGFAVIFRSQLGSGDGYIAIFSGRVPKYIGKPFGGAFAIALFGGVDMLLQEAVITEDVSIDCIALFGGVDVRLPDNVNAEVGGFPIFGGIGEPKNRPHIEGAPTVHVNALCAFGGVDVK